MLLELWLSAFNGCDFLLGLGPGGGYQFSEFRGCSLFTFIAKTHLPAEQVLLGPFLGFLSCPFARIASFHKATLP